MGRYWKHEKTAYEVLGEPFDRPTIIKVGDWVKDNKRNQEGVVVRMVRSVNKVFGFVDWHLKVKLESGKCVWHTGPYHLEVVPGKAKVPTVTGPRLLRKD